MAVLSRFCVCVCALARVCVRVCVRVGGGGGGGSTFFRSSGLRTRVARPPATT
jgi:hypothetical protein